MAKDVKQVGVGDYVDSTIGVGATFRDLMAERLALKITQADMAVIIGVSRLTYIKWEKNMSLMPIGRYKQICNEFNRMTKLATSGGNL